MSSIADDVIGGVNTFVAEQAADGDDARLTLVQFDSQDAHEVVLRNERIDRVPELTHDTFVPRGTTPLLDATGRVIERAARRAAKREKAGKKPEEIVIVTVTDGQENASESFTVARIREMIDRKRAEGWTFVFLSADIDAYSEAGNLGYDVRSVQGWAPDGKGARTAFVSVSRSAAAKRRMVRDKVDHDAGDSFQGLEEAEQSATGPMER
jgi:hypothetical protein